MLFIFFFVKTTFSQDYWEIVDTPDTAGICCIHINNNGHIYIGGFGHGNNMGGIHRSIDGSETWEFFNIKTNVPVYTIKENSLGQMFAGLSFGIYKSLDGGETWYETQMPFSVTANIVSVELLNDSILFAGGHATPYIFRSVDYGESWDTVYCFPGGSGEEYANCFAFSPEGVVYAGTDNDFVDNERGVYRSYDCGETWEFVDMEGEGLLSLSFDNNGVLWAGTIYNGLFKYDEQTQEWESVVYGRSVNDILVNKKNDIFLACLSYPSNTGGVMVSYDNGQSFEYINSGLGWQAEKLAIDISGFIYTCFSVLNHPDTLYKSVESTTGINKDILNINTIAAQCFPNPFKDKTCIDLSVFYPNYGCIRVSIYNSAGILVKYEKCIRSDYYLFNGHGKETGVYYYNIISGDKYYTGKMLLIE